MSNERQNRFHSPMRPGEPEVDLSGLNFLQVPDVEGPSAVWAASHQALRGLIRSHQRDLSPCQGLAADIRQQMEALFPLLDAVCRRTCPWCPDPCCIVTRVWYDFIDLLFLHFMETPLPPAPLAERLDDPCRFLSGRGCRLPRLIRPWGCIQYTCATQRRNLRRRNPADETRLDRTLDAIRDRRYRLEKEFRRVVVG